MPCSLLCKKWACNGYMYISYIDDFITLGVPDTVKCAEHVRLMHIACEEVDLPVEVEKDEGPASSITFIGIEFDSDALEIRLSQDTCKLECLKALLATWRGRKACKKRDLLSLIGLLSHACKAV